MNLTERRRALMVTATSGSPHGKCGPYAYWSIKDGVLTISGTGTLYNDATHYKPDFPAPWNEYNDDIFEIEVQDGITYISQYAFYHLTNVEKATIPESVVYVHAHAFNGCTALEDVYFYMKSGEVYYWAFQDCNARKRIHIASVADYCNVKLDQISYPAETDLILNGTKVTDLVIPSGVKTTNTFNHMTIETVFIPRSAALRDVAFEMCTHLRSVTFERGSKITSVPANAFRGCSSLVNIDNLPDTIEIINGGSFAQCPLFQMEQLPASLTTIKSNQYGAFSGSSSISISETNPEKRLNCYPVK